VLNPDLIKRGIDDEEYSNACPTIGTLMIAHFSTPELHRSDIFQADESFFAANPSRRTYLRPAFKLEYDLDEAETQNIAPPMLWVCVSQHAPGFHMILPVWRGQAFWNGRQSDSGAGVGALLLQMCLRGGIHIAEWYSYISDQRVRKADKSKSRKKGLVN
jgi:hypothetical protein